MLRTCRSFGGGISACLEPLIVAPPLPPLAPPAATADALLLPDDGAERGDDAGDDDESPVAPAASDDAAGAVNGASTIGASTIAFADGGTTGRSGPGSPRAKMAARREKLNLSVEPRSIMRVLRRFGGSPPTVHSFGSDGDGGQASGRRWRARPLEHAGASAAAGAAKHGGGGTVARGTVGGGALPRDDEDNRALPRKPTTLPPRCGGGRARRDDAPSDTLEPLERGFRVFDGT